MQVLMLSPVLWNPFSTVIKTYHVDYLPTYGFLKEMMKYSFNALPNQAWLGLGPTYLVGGNVLWNVSFPGSQP